MLFKNLVNLLDLRHVGINKIKDTQITSFDIYVGPLQKNSVYFHWKVGEKNLFLIDMAIARGAFVITSERKFQDQQHDQVIYVSSVRKILHKIALYQRDRFNGEVIAVTGSVGKSSVKNMLADVLGMTRPTLHTMGNENAYLGIFCTLCNINEKTQCIVLETGASGPKTLSIPIQVVKPTISILLDVNWSHQEKYSEFKELLEEKASIISALVPGGKLIANNTVLAKLNEINYKFRSDIMIQSISETGDSTADIQILKIDLNMSETQIIVKNNGLDKIKLKQCNYANGINAVYCWSVCKILGLSLSQFNSLVAFYKPLPRRFERIRICNTDQKIYELIDDAYNASPASTFSLIQSLVFRQTRRKILVLGDMLELGEDAAKLHQEILQSKLLEQFNKILIIGENYKKCHKPQNAIFCESLEQLLCFLKDNINTGDLVALKASNSMNFYKVRQLLEKEAIHSITSTSWFIENEFEP